MNESSIDNSQFSIASMTERAKMLAGPDYFSCERTHARIKKTDCINRQTEGVRLEGSLKKEIPPECKECPQGKGIIAEAAGRKGENMDKEDIKQAFEAIKAACEEKDCQFWNADGCRYDGALFKGTCKRKYMREYYQGKKAQGAEAENSKTHKEAAPSGSGKPVSQAASVQGELEQPAEGTPDAPTVLLDFEGLEDVYQHLERAAQEEVRTPELQALWYVKRGLRDREILE